MTVFQKASRRKQKLKIGIAGPSGSGKSLGALALAHQLASSPDKVAAIDTENGSLSLYSDRYPFDGIEIDPPYLTSKYLEAIKAAVAAGYEVLLIDSISHQWDGDGGILQRKDEADCRPGTNHWTNWKPFTEEHNGFRAALLHADIHVIATMRSKMAYTQTAGSEGKKGKVEKLGLQPIQREGLEYEFALTFDVAMDHKADASKDRTSLFVGKRTDLLDPKTGKKLLDWLATAAPELPPVPAPAVPAPAPQASAPARQEPAQAASRPAAGNGKATMSPAALTLLSDGKMPIGNSKGQPISRLEDKDLLSALTWCREQDAQKFAPLIHALQTEYQSRQPLPLGVGQDPSEGFDEMPKQLAKGGDDDLPF